MGDDSLSNVLLEVLNVIEDCPETSEWEKLEDQVNTLTDDFYKIISFSYSVPYLAITDREETQDVREGVYIAYFFEKDGSAVTLTLIQGVKSVLQGHDGDAKTVLRERAEDIQESLNPRGFDQAEPDLPTAKASGSFPSLYAPATVLYKQYSPADLQGESTAQSDLAALLKTYKEYMDRDVSATPEPTTILHIGPCHLSERGFGPQTQSDSLRAFEDVAAQAVRSDVDAVVQTGGFWDKNEMSDDYRERLTAVCERLERNGIPFYYVPSSTSRITDQIGGQLANAGLISELGPDPTMVGDVALVGTQPDTEIETSLESISRPKAAHTLVVVSPDPVAPPVETKESVDLDVFKTQAETIDLVLAANLGTTAAETYHGRLDVFTSGPIAPVFSESALFQDGAPSPYPATITELTFTGDTTDKTEHELAHRPLHVIDIRADADVSVNQVWDEISDISFADATVALQFWSPDKYDRRPDQIEQRVDRTAFATRTWHKQTESVPSQGVTVEVETYGDLSEENHQNGSGDSGHLETVYMVASDETDVDNYTQKVFTHGVIGTASDKEMIGEGDGVLLHDTGDHQYDENQVYGPFEAITSATTQSGSVWDGKVAYQVEVDWGQLYRIDTDALDLSGNDQPLVGEQATACIDQLKADGTKITVTPDGEIEDVEQERDDIAGGTGSGLDTDGQSEGKTDVITLRETSEPLDIGTAIESATQPGVAILQQAVDGQLRPDLYRQALAHLIAGKNVVFYGPPGSGKTHIAKRLSYGVCAEVEIATANAEWTYQQVVGGYQPTGESFEPSPGILTTTAAACETTLQQFNHPSWLLVDELNRANLDEAFGDVFTLLDIDHRHDNPLSYAKGASTDGDTQQMVPLAFRILGTMNTQDQAQLFALGYAFRRRFAFIKVPPLHVPQPEVDTTITEGADVDISPQSERALQIIRSAVRDFFDQQTPDADSPYGLPQLEETVFESDSVVDQSLSNIRPSGSGTPLAPDRALMAFVESLTENSIADIGQGILIDVLKYLIVTERLFPKEAGWETLDEAIVAYVFPQIEPYMSELRRANTVDGDSDAIERFRRVQEHAQLLGFTQTANRLARAEETHQVIE